MDSDATKRSEVFKELSQQFAPDAQRDSRRSLVFAVLAFLTTLTGAVVSSAGLWRHTVGLRTGATIGAIYLFGGIPLWWQSNSYRRSASEQRRLELHTRMLEPYLAGFDPENGTIMRATLAQKLFARVIDDHDILREASWPTPDQLRTAAATHEEVGRHTSPDIARPQSTMTSSADDKAFKVAARGDAVQWKASTETLPAAARGPGKYRDHDALPFCMPREFHQYNLLPEGRSIALQRFSAAGIPWHDGFDNGPSNHLLDSQVQCANALAPFVEDPASLAAIFGQVLPIDEVLPFGAEGGSGHLSPFDATDSVVFEWQGLDNHLNEWLGTPTRGSMATSADAAIRYRAIDGSTELALIEWKFTESYPDGQLSTKTSSTATRLSRYQPLFDLADGPVRSDLIHLVDLLGEPVYQLMRLSLLARCIETSHEQGVDRARVVYVAPAANHALWASPGTSVFSSHAAGRPLDQAWASLLRKPDSWAFLDSASLLGDHSPVSNEFKTRYAALAATG